MSDLTAKQFKRAAIFVAIVFLLVALLGCESEPAERVIRSSRPAIFKFKPGNEYLIDHVAINFNSLGVVTGYTDPYDNRWARPNTYVYAEQIQWGHLYFADITMKQQFDYARIYGCPMPADTIIAHIVAAADSVMPIFYQAHERSGPGPYTVEFFDLAIETGQLSKYVENMKRP